MTEEEIEGIEEALNLAADLGFELMLKGGTSLDAVERAIIFWKTIPYSMLAEGLCIHQN